MNSETLSAIAAVPSTHFGLDWGHSATPNEIAALAHRCEEHDSVVPRSPRAALDTQFVPKEHAAVLTGHDSSGELRVVASVHWAHDDAPGTAALRAHIDPRWRGRGVGRQVLAWQDSVAISALAGFGSGLIGVTIPSGLIDRRRLYTAAGFSSRGRVQSYQAVLSEQRLEVPDPGMPVVSLRDLGELAQPERSLMEFVTSGMSASDRLATADRDASYSTVRGEEVIGSLLVHITHGAGDEPAAMIHDLRPGSAAAPALLAAAYRTLQARGIETAYIRIAPPSLGSWEDAVLELGATPSGAYVIYSIEWP